MSKLRNLIKEELKNILAENTTVKYNVGERTYEFELLIDANEDKTKKGIKIKFRPKGTLLTDEEHSRLQIKLKDKLNDGLDKLGMSVDTDTEGKDPQVIGFMLSLDYLEQTIKDTLR